MLDYTTDLSEQILDRSRNAMKKRYYNIIDLYYVPVSIRSLKLSKFDDRLSLYEGPRNFVEFRLIALSSFNYFIIKEEYMTFVFNLILHTYRDFLRLVHKHPM